MADDAPPLLHLLKAGRVLQYRQQNVALVSAEQGTEFEITYAERWLAPDLAVTVGDEAIVILSDSPYTKVDPARYATVTAAERSRTGLSVTIAVGAWPVVEDDDVLTPPLRAHPTQPPYFVWSAPPIGIRAPRSDHESNEAWRRVVDRLRGNTNYAATNFARLVRVLDPRGREVRERRLDLGETAVALLEVQSPGGDDQVHSVLVDADPSGSVVGGIEKERADSTDHLHVPVRPLVAGTHTIDLSFVPDPLLSTRVSFTIEAATPSAPLAAEIAEATGAAGDTADPTLVQALAERLRRIDAIDANQWLALLQDHILALAPDDPMLRSMTAEAAYDLGDYQLVIDLLDDPARFRAGDAFRRLSAGLRYSIPTEVGTLLREIDFGAESNVARLEAELPHLPDGAVRQIAEVVLDDLADKSVLDRLLPAVFTRLPDDLALRVMQECAPVDPARWLHRALDRWPDPHHMPDDTRSEILTWDISSAALAPFVREAIEQHIDDGELDDAHDLVQRSGALLPKVDHLRIRAVTARLLLRDDATSAAARTLLIDAADDVRGSGEPSIATELAFTMRAAWPAGTDKAVDDAVDQLRASLADLTDFQEWREKRTHDAAVALRPALEARVVHVVAGPRPPWAAQLADDLGLAALQWHGTDELTDHIATIGERDLVVVIWTHCDRAAVRALDIAGIAYRRSPLTRAGILAALAL